MSTYEKLQPKTEWNKEVVITSGPKMNQNSFWERVLENHGYTKEQLEEYYSEFIGK